MQVRIRIRLVLLAIMLILSLSLAVNAAGSEAEPVCSYTELIEAISDAAEGETIYVGDMDFDTETFRDDLDRITIDRSVTLCGVGTDGRTQAVFSNGSLDLIGSAVAGEGIICRFENILFDGNVDGKSLTARDWVIDETASDPELAQYAVSLRGNAQVSFHNCGFVNYMYAYGPVVNCSYDADVTSSLSLSFENCEFRDNHALYAGGALYLRGVGKNVKLTAKDCVFSGNVSGVGDPTMYFGGGAMHLYSVHADLDHCVFLDNMANYNYSDALPAEMDLTKGGAIYAMDCDVQMTGCELRRNTASAGGAISAYVSRFLVDGCILSENRAQFHSEAPVFRWPQCGAQMGLAGAVYVNGSTGDAMRLYNCTVSGNSASVAYGGIYGEYNSDMTEDWGFPRVELALCSYLDNTSDTSEYGHEMLWYFSPGNIWDIPYFSAFGSVIIDDTLEAPFLTYERPSAENGYTYFACPASAASDGIFDDVQTDSHVYVSSEAVPDLTLPVEAVEQYFSGRYDAYLGDFAIGNNFNPVITFTGDASGTVQYSVPVEIPAPDVPGYTVSRWSRENGEAFDSKAPLFGHGCAELELYAELVPQTYQATFDDGDRTVSLTQTYGSRMTLPDAPERKGLRFGGWYTESGEKVTGDYGYTSDMTFFARYEKDLSWLMILLGAVLLVGAFAAIRRKRKTAQPVAAAPVPSEPRIIRTRYTESEIDAIIERIHETQLLTARELDVFRELLKGKKQSEIAYYLGISVSTVKDNAGRIYGKLGIANKSELFALIDEKMDP